MAVLVYPLSRFKLVIKTPLDSSTHYIRAKPLFLVYPI